MKTRDQKILAAAVSYARNPRTPRNALYRVDGWLYTGRKGFLGGIRLIGRDSLWRRIKWRLGLA